MVLSILICSLKSRATQLNQLRDHLGVQIRDATQVEVLDCVDNKENTTGWKRNWLISQAKGKYIVFIDDDDWVPKYYIDELLKACASDCDCVAINGIMTTNGGHEIQWFLSKDNDNVTVNRGGKKVYLRKTNHITAVKREHALQTLFPDCCNAEDKAYSEALNPLLKTEYTIQKPMYHYQFSTYNKEYK